MTVELNCFYISGIFLETRANSIDKWFGGSDGAVASAYGVLKTPVDVHPAGDIKLVGVGMRHGSSRDISLDEKLSRSQRSGKRQENTNSATSALELSLDKWCLDLRSMVLVCYFFYAVFTWIGVTFLKYMFQLFSGAIFSG